MGGGTSPPQPDSGGGNAGDNDFIKDDKPNDMEQDSDEEEPEDPSNRQWYEVYKPKTEGGKAIAKMFRTFCQLVIANAHDIVFYFGIYSESKLADFQKMHWKVTFAQLQKRHICADGTKRAMVLFPLQQDCIQCTTCDSRNKQELGGLGISTKGPDCLHG